MTLFFYNCAVFRTFYPLHFLLPFMVYYVCDIKFCEINKEIVDMM